MASYAFIRQWTVSSWLAMSGERWGVACDQGPRNPTILGKKQTIATIEINSFSFFLFDQHQPGGTEKPTFDSLWLTDSFNSVWTADSSPA